MKEVKMFSLKTCPHCKKAILLMEEICSEYPEYKAVKVDRIDEREQADYAANFDYYYVPTFYVGNIKMHEGAPTKEAIKKVYTEAVKDS